MKENPTIDELIIDFQQHVKIVAQIFYKKYNRKDLLRAWHDGTISQRGSGLDRIKNYSFHGAGLYAKIGKVEVDFDFGPEDCIDGFDAWRLRHFAQSKKDMYPHFQEEKLIQSELDKLAREKRIVRLGEGPGITNYYWKE
jgi:hypothetical protein